MQHIWAHIGHSAFNFFTFKRTLFYHKLFIISSLCLTLCTSILYAQSPIDIQHYHLDIRIPDVSKAYIEGEARVEFKLNAHWVDTLSLELQALKVSKVTLGRKRIPFTQKGNQLHILLPTLDTQRVHSVTVTYKGVPLPPSSFGGLYFREGYFYNMGVGISDIPHNLGKALFPCVDNFTDKATYMFILRVPKGLQAVAGGMLSGLPTHKGKQTTWRWQLTDPIPTYLASVAVGRFAVVRDSCPSLTGRTIPIELWVPDSLQAAAGGSFGRLKEAIALFEKRFGPYAWQRVGYVGVPFDGGAMEHATNIAYPQEYLDGTSKMDRLWVHELSHSWFGNLVTCSTAQDMWLNEGFARYSEALFIESVSGSFAFHRYMQGIQRRVLEFSKRTGEGFLALSPMPEEHTYGLTTYDKGALVAHEIRLLMGDSLFFAALRDYFRTYRMSNANHWDLKRVLERHLGRNLDAFWQSEVLGRGFHAWIPHSVPAQMSENRYRIPFAEAFGGAEVPKSRGGIVHLRITEAETTYTQSVEVQGDSSGAYADIQPRTGALISAVLDSIGNYHTAMRHLGQFGPLSNTPNGPLQARGVWLAGKDSASIGLWQWVPTLTKADASPVYELIPPTGPSGEVQFGLEAPTEGSYRLEYRPRAHSSWQPVRQLEAQHACKRWLYTDDAAIGQYRIAGL